MEELLVQVWHISSCACQSQGKACLSSPVASCFLYSLGLLGQALIQPHQSEASGSVTSSPVVGLAFPICLFPSQVGTKLWTLVAVACVMLRGPCLSPPQHLSGAEAVL